MIQENNQAMIEKPTIGQILAIERKLKGERLEMFQEAFDVLHDEKQTGHNSDIAWRIANLQYLLRGFERVNRESRDSHSRPAGVLHVKLNHEGKRYDLGLVSVNVVTTAGVNFIIDAMQNLVEPELMKYHASGTGAVAEAIGDTALGTEVDTRVAGTQIEGASANIYKTVATLTYTATRTITEHGLFSQLALGGTLFDRSVFTGIGVDTSTNIQFTYEWTLNSGG